MSDYLGTVLKYARSTKGMSQEQTGEAIHLSSSMIAMIETGRRIPHPDIAARLDEFFGTGDLISKLTAEARSEVQPRWFLPWREVEQEATVLRCYEQGIIPGLLQTESYARAALTAGFATDEQAEQGAMARIERQALLEKNDPPLSTFVIDEVALRREDPVILKEQLLHLVEIGQRRRVIIQVVPIAAGAYIGQSGGFTIAATAGGDTLGFVEDQLAGRVIADLKQVALLERAWDAVRAVALPRDQSRDFILKVVDAL